MWKSSPQFRSGRRFPDILLPNPCDKQIRWDKSAARRRTVRRSGRLLICWQNQTYPQPLRCKGLLKGLPERPNQKAFLCMPSRKVQYPARRFRLQRRSGTSGNSH